MMTEFNQFHFKDSGIDTQLEGLVLPHALNHQFLESNRETLTSHRKKQSETTV